MRIIETETIERLRILDGSRPDLIFKKNFTTLTFQLIDPVSKKILKKYDFQKSEFDSLTHTEKSKYKTLEKSEIFDEKGYLKSKKVYEKEMAIYNERYAKNYLLTLKENGITEKEDNKVNEIMSIVLEEFSFDGYSDDQTRIDFEDSILSTIK